jgi:hypothetical protein
MAEKDSKGKKKVKTFYISEENINFLNQRAFEESTPNSRVSDDAILDAYLDHLRESHPTQPVKAKKNAVRAVSAPLAV